METAKARTQLGTHPRWTLADAVRRTMDWYRAQHAGADARDLCLADVAQLEGQTQ